MACDQILSESVFSYFLGYPASSSVTRRRVCRQTVNIRHLFSCFHVYLLIPIRYVTYSQSLQFSYTPYILCIGVACASPVPVQQIVSYLTELKLYLQFSRLKGRNTEWSTFWLFMFYVFGVVFTFVEKS